MKTKLNFRGLIPTRNFSALIGLGLALVLPALTGCHSMKPVVVQRVTPGEVSEIIQEVFHEQGFITAKANFNHIVLEKEGTGWNNFAYGNWTRDSQMWVRVKVDVARTGETGFKIQATAFNVRDRNGTTEEELKIHSAGKYQDLLDEAARRINQASRK